MIQDLSHDIAHQEICLFQILQSRQYSHICTEGEVSKITANLKALYDQIFEDAAGQTVSEESLSFKWPTVEGMQLQIHFILVSILSVQTLPSSP